jgi:effector-binding domain-containing protein
MIACYEPAGGDAPESVMVHAGVTVAADARAGDGVDVADLPTIPTAATIIHHGSMDEADRSMHVLARWIEDHGYRMLGYPREVCLEFTPDQPEKWVHEFQVGIERPPG